MGYSEWEFNQYDQEFMRSEDRRMEREMTKQCSTKLDKNFGRSLDSIAKEEQLARWKTEEKRAASSAHTPGPWTVNRSADQYGYYCIDEAEYEQEHAYDADSELGENDVEARDIANARLISAAPELLEALEAARPVIVGALAFVDCKAQLRQLEAAIQKARGGR